MNPLPAAEAYRLWAPEYETETAVSYLEDLAVGEMGPPAEGLRLLDVGCGTGRRTRAAGARLAVGIDLTAAMLLAGARPGPSTLHFLTADARSLPVRSGGFDLVWCRLMIGHVPDPRPVYAELARVCAPDGFVIVSDLHPAAVAAGHRRTFRDTAGQLHEVEHRVHSLADHTDAARRSGLTMIGRQDAVVGPEIEAFYARASRPEMYASQRGLSLVLVLSFQRTV